MKVFGRFEISPRDDPKPPSNCFITKIDVEGNPLVIERDYTKKEVIKMVSPLCNALYKNGLPYNHTVNANHWILDGNADQFCLRCL